jgi:uncharacterized protein affecting Mg2+/Co2+ transport
MKTHSFKSKSMKYIFSIITVLSVFLITSCKSDSDNQLIYDYQIDILKPVVRDWHIGEALEIKVQFNSQTGEEIHHINIRIINKSTQTVVYDKPDPEHVDTPESYTYSDTFILSTNNGFVAGDWILEAKVWGHEDFVEEVTKDFEFHILP